MRRGPRIISRGGRIPARPTQNLPSTSDDYETGPTPSDVRLVRAYLKHLKLPTEIALDILDAANYRPLLIAGRDESISLEAGLSGRGNEAATLYLTSPQIPIGVKRAGITHSPKSIAFRTKSHDQGYCSEPGLSGTYNGHTWFEITILRPASDLDPSRTLKREPLEREFPRQPLPKWTNPEAATEAIRYYGWQFVSNAEGNIMIWKVQTNFTANNQEREHYILWEKGQKVETINPETNDSNGKGDGKGFFETLREGDRVALWARALYPGWVNHIKEASIEIKYDEHQRELDGSEPLNDIARPSTR